MAGQIDQVEQLDLLRLKAGDLRWLYATGRGQTTGFGRNKQHSFRHGVQTPVGDIELSVWIKAAEHIIERDGLQTELEHLQPYAVDYGGGNIHSKQLSHGGHLSMCLSAIYRNPAWVFFVPYNRQYHPELLDTTPMVEVVMDCCKTACAIPRAQIHNENQTAHCPACGRWASFSYAENRTSE